MNTINRFRCVNASALKWIAMATMLIDHIAYCLVWPLYKTLDGSAASFMYGGYTTMRIIGRIAFIIFAFELAQGAKHTHNFPKYFARLGVFAIVSQMPFWLAFFPNATPWSHLNIMATLILALIAPCIAEIMREKGFAEKTARDTCIATCIIICLALIYCQPIISTDYGAYGVALVTIFYLLDGKPVPQMIAACLLTCLYSMPGNLTQLWACIPIVAVCLAYNGEHGHINKWIAYGFYPGHLALLALIAHLCFS